MTLGAIAFALALQDMPDTPVDLTLRGTRLERAVPELEKKLKLNLAVDPALEENVVAIKVRRMATSTLLKNIATANAAVWTWKVDRFVLERTPELANALKESDHKAQVASLRSWQKSLAAKVGEKFWTDAQTESFIESVKGTDNPQNTNGVSLDGPRLNGPIAGLTRWLAANVSLEPLLSLGVRQSLEYSSLAETGPTAFDAKCRAQIALVPKIYDKFKQVADARLSQSDKQVSFYKDVLDFSTATAGRLDYRLRFTHHLTYFGVMATVHDRDGKQLTWAFINVPECPAHLPGQSTPDFLKDVSTGERALPKRTQWFQSLLAQHLGSSNVAPGPAIEEKGFSAEDKKLWAEPLLNDPLSYTATDIAFALADQRDVVAVLPDLMIAATHRSVTRGKLNFASFWAQQKAKAPVSFSLEGNCLIMKPALTTLAERLSTDRHALQDVLQALNKHGYVRLVDWATYCERIKCFNNYRWAEYLLMSPYVTSGFQTPHPIRMHEDMSSEFLGTLGGTVLNQLDAGRPFSINRFDHRQKELLNQMGAFYWPDDSVRDNANPIQVSIVVTPIEIGTTWMDFKSGGRMVQDFDLSTPTDKSQFEAQALGANSGTMFRHKADSRRFRMTITWSNAPEVTLDLIEYGLKKPYKAPSQD